MFNSESDNDDLVKLIGRKTKLTHPYSYDPVLQFLATEGMANRSCYSDRFFSWWGYANVRSKMLEHFGESGDYWDARSPEKIEAFLRDMTQKPDLKLIRIEEHCNQTTGYPVWHFQYFDPTVT